MTWWGLVCVELDRQTHLAAPKLALPEVAPDFGDLLDTDTQLAQVALDVVAELAGIDKQGGLVDADPEIGVEEGIVGDIAAAEIEQPGNGAEGRDKGRVVGNETHGRLPAVPVGIVAAGGRVVPRDTLARGGACWGRG